MVLMKKPTVTIPWNNGNFGPQGYFPYYVMTGDNFENIAARDGRADVWDLIRDNFQTEDAKEVNWYLQHYVGCTVTKDGKNYSFSAIATHPSILDIGFSMYGFDLYGSNYRVIRDYLKGRSQQLLCVRRQNPRPSRFIF